MILLMEHLFTKWLAAIFLHKTGTLCVPAQESFELAWKNFDEQNWSQFVCN